jgi:hypothetical protein
VRGWARCGLLLGLVLGLLHGSACLASSTRFCDRPLALSIEQQDRLFRWSGIIKQELEQSGQRVALIARSGTNLGRFGIRYSHAAISLKASANTPWSARQLYFACDEQRPRLFDQGLSGFLLGSDQPELGYLSIVFLPPDEAQALERTALDNGAALQLLNEHYSANAYAYALSYQNCNQWVSELLALAWGMPSGDEPPRARAQQWLQAQGYEPSTVQVGSRWLMWASVFIPWVHNDDHPAEDLARRVYRVSMPASIEQFVQQRLAGATRVEVCHRGARVVVHRGWDPVAEGCEPGPGDEVIHLD